MPVIPPVIDPERFTQLQERSNQLNERNDCTVKAVAVVCDVTYDVAHKAMKAAGRKNRYGAYNNEIIAAVNSLGYSAKHVMYEVDIKLRYPELHQGLQHLTTYHPKRFKAAWAHLPDRMLLMTPKHVAAMIERHVIDFTHRKACRIQQMFVVEKLEDFKQTELQKAQNELNPCKVFHKIMTGQIKH